MPGTIGFVSEISIICGIFEYFPIVGFIIIIPTALAAFRNYLLFTQICLGNPSSFLSSYNFFPDKSGDSNTEWAPKKINRKVFIVKS